MFKYIILFCLLFTHSVHAETDKVAHFGVSYVLTDISTKLYEKAFRMPKPQAAIFGSAFVLLIGVAKEYTDNNFDDGDILANIAGIAAKNLVRFTLEF